LDHIFKLTVDDADTEIVIVVYRLLLGTAYWPLNFPGNLENVSSQPFTELLLLKVEAQFEEPISVGLAVAIHNKPYTDDAILSLPLGHRGEFHFELTVNGEGCLVHHGLKLVALPHPVGIAELKFGVVGPGIKRNIADALRKCGVNAKHKKYNSHGSHG
jgi:hypothetical protein